MYASVEFLLPAGSAFIAMLVGADHWEIDHMPTAPVMPRPVFLSDQAAGLVAQMGWAIDAVERSARFATACVG